MTVRASAVRERWPAFNAHNSDFSIVSLSLFRFDCARSRLGVSVRATDTRLSAVRMCVCVRARMTVCNVFAHSVFFIFISSRYAVPTLFDL